MRVRLLAEHLPAQPTGDFWISTAFHTDQPPVSDELTQECQLILKRFFFCTVSGTLFFGKTKRKCGGHSTRQSRVSRSNCYILQNQNIPSLICPAISIIFKIIRIHHTAFSPHVSFLSVTTRMQKNTKRRLIIKDIHSCLFTICRINRPIIAAHNMIFTIPIPVGFLNFNFISWSFLQRRLCLNAPVSHMKYPSAQQLRQSVILAAGDTPRCGAAIKNALTCGSYRSAQSRCLSPDTSVPYMEYPSTQ